MVTTSRPLHAKMDEALAALMDINRLAGVEAAAAARQHYARARTEIVIGILLCIGVGFAVSTMVARRMTASLGAVIRAATSLQQNCVAGCRRAIDSLALGDMSVRTAAVTQFINNTDADEIGDMARTCDRMIVDVKGMLAAVTVTQERVDSMVADALRLVDAARAGTLDVRADPEQYEGSFRALVGGLNDTLQAVATPMGEVNGVLAQVADRDLTLRVTGSYRGTFASVAHGVNTAIENLDTTLAQVSSAAIQVAHATTEITSSAQTLASGASEQAASLEEISASVHVFASMTQHSAASAIDASRLAASARDEATEGAARMERLTQAVTEIRESSTATAKIIRTIDEIAFQTNLLALNAAVEAARAGDAGRGFAVVADEVRSLALRAAAAAHTTSDLIEKGQGAAERGVALNAEVLQSRGRINDQIVQVAEVTTAISTASRQQEEGVQQIMTAVDQINTITQQVAASAEESASAATELSSQSQSLRDTVDRFTLTGRSHEAPPTVASRPRAAGRAAPIAYRKAPRPLATTAAGGSVFTF
jgi:methyl-accepting chemotaxis protein